MDAELESLVFLAGLPACEQNFDEEETGRHADDQAEDAQPTLENGPQPVKTLPFAIATGPPGYS